MSFVYKNLKDVQESSYKKAYLNENCGYSFCVVNWITITFIGKPQKVKGNCVKGNHQFGLNWTDTRKWSHWILSF